MRTFRQHLSRWIWFSPQVPILNTCSLMVVLRKRCSLCTNRPALSFPFDRLRFFCFASSVSLVQSSNPSFLLCPASSVPHPPPPCHHVPQCPWHFQGRLPLLFLSPSLPCTSCPLSQTAGPPHDSCNKQLLKTIRQIVPTAS